MRQLFALLVITFALVCVPATTQAACSIEPLCLGAIINMTYGACGRIGCCNIIYMSCPQGGTQIQMFCSYPDCL